MSYVLKLAGWYPSRIDAFNGDFVQRHAKSIATQHPIVVLYATKDEASKTISIETNSNGNLTEIIAYYPKRNFLDKPRSHSTYMRIMKKMCKQVISERGLPFVVHVNIVWKAGLVAKWLHSKFDLSYCITENWTGYYPADPNYILKNPIRKWLFNSIYKNAAYLLPVTTDLGHRCNQLFKMNLPYTVVENAVDVTQFNNLEQIVKPTVNFIHISTMGYQKNTIGLLEVFKDVLPTKPNYQLKLVGPLSQEVKFFLHQHQDLKDKIICTGNIAYELVAAQLQQADCLVLFSRYENLPCVILESLCCGVPVIATDVGGIKEVINETNGVIIMSENKNALREALISFDATKYNCVEMASAAQSLFSYEAIGKKYRAAYMHYQNL